MKKIYIPEKVKTAYKAGQPAAAPYNWKSVITGGGGFIPGVVYHPAIPGLCYLRSDMGGAYKRGPMEKNWSCITDMFGKDEAIYNGILSLAIDPAQPSRVYMMTGKYTGENDPNGAFHSSDDTGLTWSRTELAFKVGGNELGRGTGERVAVDPNDASVIFMGSTKDGLWRSGDYGASWDRVKNFPAININFVIFHGPSGIPGNKTPVIFAAAADTTESLYISKDAGKTWVSVAGQPEGLMALRADIAGQYLYVTFSDGPGPWGITKGSAWKYDIKAGAWTNMNLPEGEGGFSGISVDARNPLHMAVSTMNRYHPGDEVYRSTDGGKTWKGVLGGSEWDKTSAPYIKTMTPHWTADVKIDPFNSSNAMFVTGYGIWATKNFTSKKVKWRFDNSGVEESVAMQIISPPQGARLISAMGDHDGFIHEDLDASSKRRFQPEVGTTLAIAFAGKAPAKLVKACGAKPFFGACSADGGKTWTSFSSCPDGTRWGGSKTIALSADGKTIVWNAPGARISYSDDNGANWAQCAGDIHETLWPFADSVNPEKFYVYDGVQGCLHISKDRGRSFIKGASGMPRASEYHDGDGMADFSAAAVFETEGHIWIAAGYGGLYRSVDSGMTAYKIESVSHAFRIGFGKAPARANYPAIYLWGAVDGITGFFRSDDEGLNWVRINDDKHQYGWIHCIIGDPGKYGRCYVSAEGRGIFYGDIG